MVSWTDNPATTKHDESSSSTFVMTTFVIKKKIEVMKQLFWYTYHFNKPADFQCKFYRHYPFSAKHRPHFSVVIFKEVSSDVVFPWCVRWTWRALKRKSSWGQHCNKKKDRERGKDAEGKLGRMENGTWKDLGKGEREKENRKISAVGMERRRGQEGRGGGREVGGRVKGRRK